MKPVITIMPDYGGAYAWKTSSEKIASSGVGPCIADVHGWHNEISISHDLHVALAAWQGEFEGLRDFADFDWCDYHRRGISLARRLKTEIGDQAIHL